MAKKKVPTWIGGAVTLGVFAALVWLERRRPLRHGESEPQWTRDARNLAVAGAGGLVVQLLERPVAERLAALAERQRWGLLNIWPLPAWLETTLAVLLLDYTLYLWHVATHRVPLLWRFHVAHHADLDLDASTALRFHFGELTLSVAWRAAQIVGIGVSPRALSIWQLLLFPAILFHHSNVDLPLDWERRLNRLVVTPRMHGIHHSIVREEADANWSSGLTVWDWLHGTLRLGVSQDEIRIGVPAYREPEDVTLAKTLALPFVEQPPAWRLPDGRRPTRDPRPGAPSRLLD